jgi:hypothetical protein
MPGWQRVQRGVAERQARLPQRPPVPAAAVTGCGISGGRPCRRGPPGIPARVECPLSQAHSVADEVSSLARDAG